MNGKMKSVTTFLLGMCASVIIFLLLFGDIIPYYLYYNMVNNLYDGEVDSSAMQESILSGITDGLGDMHSVYFPPIEADNFMSSLESNHKGIGIKYLNNTNQLQISEILENSPASEVGLYPGDIIKSINGTVIDESNISDPVSLFYSDQESTLEIYRPSTDEEFEIKVQAGDFVTPTVDYQIIDNTGNETVGYIAIDSFADDTDDEFEIALNELEQKNIDKLIIDVRNNGGGNLDTVINIINMVVYSPDPFLYTKIGDRVIDEEMSTLEAPKDYDLVVLQNENSASASEVLSAAIGQAGGGTIVGKQSYGKGSVQKVIDIPFNLGSAKITYAHWFTPNDENIDDIGITPDIEVQDSALDYINLSPIVLDEELKIGDNSVDVAKLNNYLSILGYQSQFNSLTFNQTTLDALNAYQRDNDLTITNTLDYKTAYQLYNDAVDNIVNPLIDPYLEAAINI